MHFSRIATIAILLCVLSVTSAQAQSSYTLTRIVVPTAPFGPYPTGLSQDGWVVGQVRLCCNQYSSWLWRPAVPNGTTGTLTDYGQLGMQAVNFTGVQNGHISFYYKVVGLAGAFGHVWHVAPDGTITETPMAACHPPDWDPSYGAQPNAVNSLGQVAGSTCTNAAFWPASGSPARMTWDPNGSAGGANAINDRGYITGNSNAFTHNPYGMAFVASPGGSPQYIPMVPTTAGCWGASINESNDVAGNCITHPENGGGPRGFAYISGELILFGCDASGAASCPNSDAHGINNRGEVVGSLNGAAFIWDRTRGIRYLSTLVPGSPEISAAYAINDAGQILVECGNTFQGTQQPCLLTPAPAADLSIMKIADSSVTVGNTLTYAITIANSGPNAATHIVVTDTLPAGATFVSATPSAGSCSGAPAITCALGSLAFGASATVTIVVTASTPGTLVNSATVSGDQADPVSSNNTAAASTMVNRRTPVITWNTPAPIVYGVALGGAQLNASADTPGSFAYSAAPGTVFHAGDHTLDMTFTPASSDYESATASVTLTVTPAPLMITADDKSKVYGAPLPALTMSYTGFVNGDSASSLTAAPVASTAAAANTAVGGYPITASGASSADYAIAYTPGTLTVAPAATSISVAAAPNPASIGQSIAVTAMIAAVAPGAGTPTGVVTFTDGTLTIGSAPLDAAGVAALSTAALGAGSHTIRVTYGGDGNFTGSSSAPIAEVVTSPPPPSTASIADLIARVNALSLNNGQKSSLIAKLQAAQASLARGNKTAAVNQLGAFVNEVQALAQSGRVATATAAEIVSETQAVSVGIQMT